MNLNPIVEIFDGQNPVAFWTFWIFALIGIWVVWFLLTKWRSAKWYMPFWIASISVLSLWWGAALVNAFHVGNGLPGNGVFPNNLGVEITVNNIDIRPR